MDQDSAFDLREEARQLFDLSGVQKPAIKILLYTDAPDVVTREIGGTFSLGRMIEHLEGHSPAFAQFEVRWLSRYRDDDRSLTNKLHDVLNQEAGTGEPFDQIWFFGLHQINKKRPDLVLHGGSPESELTAAEVTALTKWMEEHHGGVLVTGDHAAERPADFIANDPNALCPDTKRNETFLSLGRALGRCIPRGGQLRGWEGDPTSLAGHTFNTLVPRRGIPSNEQGLQRDTLAQRITHNLFDETGQPSITGQPHPLFFYRDGLPIQFFPDHMHEGSVVLPDLSNETVWKRNSDGFQPAPHIVATGIDTDTGKTLNLLAAYDGTSVSLGRIVADSSWHHYFNINLEDFRFPGPPDSATDQIGQFYANLAVWLTPIEKRQQMSTLMVEWLASLPVTLEHSGPIPTEGIGPLLATGDAALTVLKRVASPCEIHELMQMTLSNERRQQFETLHLPEENLTMSALPSKQLMLGYLINRFSQKADESRQSVLGRFGLADAPPTERIATSELAFRRQRREVSRALKQAQKFSPVPDVSPLNEFASQIRLRSSDSSTGKTKD